MKVLSRAERDPAGFLFSCAYVFTVLAAAAFGHYPYLLPSISVTHNGLTIYNASTSSYGLGIGLVWFIPGLALVVRTSCSPTATLPRDWTQGCERGPAISRGTQKRTPRV